jgi:phage terminase small subunit
MSQNLTDKQKLFIEYFSQTGNATQSCIKAGYSEKTAEQQGYELKNKLANQIDTATKKLLGSAVPIAVDKLRKLIENDKTTPSVQLGAINSLLDRTGYQTTTKIEDVTGKKTDEELKAELDHLLGTMKIVKLTDNDDGSGSLN